MILYRVTGKVLRVASGDTISLDASQLDVRRHNIEVVKKGGPRTVVRPKSAVDFKKGEIVGIDGNLPKSLAGLVEPIESGGKQ